MRKIGIIVLTLLASICFGQQGASGPYNELDRLAEIKLSNQFTILDKAIDSLEFDYAVTHNPANLVLISKKRAKKEVFGIFGSKVKKRMADGPIQSGYVTKLKRDILDKQRELESNFNVVINFKVDEATQDYFNGLGILIYKSFAKDDDAASNNWLLNITAHYNPQSEDITFTPVLSQSLVQELGSKTPLAPINLPIGLSNSEPFIAGECLEQVETFLESFLDRVGGGTINSACFFDVSDKYLYAPNGYLFKAPLGAKLAYIASSYMVNGFTYGINVNNKNYFADIPIVNSGVQGGDQFYGYKTEIGEELLVNFVATADFGYFAYSNASELKLYKKANAVSIGNVTTTEYAINAGPSVQALINDPNTVLVTTCNMNAVLTVNQMTLFNKYKNFTVKSKTYIYEDGQLLTFFPNGKKYIKTFSVTNFNKLKQDLKADLLSNDEAILFEKIAGGYKTLINFGSNITVKSGYELNGTVKEKSEQAFENVMNAYLSDKENLAVNHNQTDSQEFEDGKKIHIKQSNIWDLVCNGVKATKEFLAEAEIKEKYWNGANSEYANNWVNTPPLLSGVGNGVIEEVKEIPQLVFMAADIATNAQTREKLWNGFKGLTLSKIGNAATSVVSNWAGTYAQGGDPAWHQGGKDGVMVFSMLTPLGFAKNADDVLSKNADDVAATVRKKADDLLDAFTKLQKEILERVRKGEIDLNGGVGNFRKGNFGEMCTDVHLAEKGYNPIHIERVDNIDNPMKPGIDGVFEKDGVFYVVESKYGSSRLNKTINGGPQMSDQWINSPVNPTKSTTRLEDAVGSTKYFEIQNVGYQRVLSEIDVNGNVTFKSINTNGSVGAILNL